MLYEEVPPIFDRAVMRIVLNPIIMAQKNKKENYRLAEALLNENEEVFNEVYEYYTDKLIRFINSIVNSRHDAEEIAQDVFYTMWVQRENLNPNLNIKSYLYTVAKNRAFDFIRKRKTHNEYVNYTINTVDEVSVSPEDIYHRKETELLVEMVLEELPKRCAEIYRLSRQKGISNSEIARKFDIKRTTVEYQISKALKALREIITITLPLPFMFM